MLDNNCGKVVAEQPISFEEALNRVGHGKCQTKVMIIGGLCILCSYVAVSAISYILPISQYDLDLTSQGKGALISSGFLGIIFSSHLWGFLSDTLGRRYILIRCLLVDGLLYITTSFAPNYWFFLVLRFFNGFSSCGGVVSAYAFIGEFHMEKFRTRAILIACILGDCIYFILPMLAWLIFPLSVNFTIIPGFKYTSWRLFYAICGIPSILTSCLLYFLPESPKFLLAKGKKDSAIKVLRRVYAENTGNPEEDLQIKNVMINEREKVAQIDYGGKSKIAAFFNFMWNQTSPLLKRPFVFNMVLLCLMQFILYFCSNGMLLWIPEIVNRVAIYNTNNPNLPGTFCQIVQNFNLVMKNTSGSNLEYLNGTSVTQKPENSAKVDTSVYINSIVLGALITSALLIILLLMKVFSRKKVFILAVIVSIISIIGMHITTNPSLLVPFIILMIILTGGLVPVVTSAAVDVFPTNLRSMAVCLTLLFGRVGTITASTIAGAVLDTHCEILIYSFIALITVCLGLAMYLPAKSDFISDEIEINKKESVCSDI